MNILQQAFLNAHKPHELAKIWSPKKKREKGGKQRAVIILLEFLLAILIWGIRLYLNAS